jgi:hypothetical protein
MGNLTLVIGESGTGKSTSTRNLDPAETFIINVLDKPLPFRGFREKYKKLKKEEGGKFIGNYIAADDADKIIKIIHGINESMPHIKNIIIDDFQYIMANEFMRRAKEKGYDKFTEIGLHAWQIIQDCALCRDDLFFFFLSHSEDKDSGKKACKTIGKMIDEKITLEGMFTTVFHSVISDGKFKFLTQNNGSYIAKSPMGMFEDNLIDNDLTFVKAKMFDYYYGDQK